MTKYAITDLDAGQLAACMAALGQGGASAASGKAPPPPPAGKPATPPPPPRKAPEPPQEESLEAKVEAAMRAYAGKYTPADVKAVFEAGGISPATVKGQPPETLEWLLTAFSA